MHLCTAQQIQHYALFDLDNTLLLGDSDHSWGNFLVAKGIVDKSKYAEKNNQFFEAYNNGTLDIHEYCAFAFEPFITHSVEKLEALRSIFVKEIITPMISPAARELVAKHQEQHHTCIIITATQSFVTKPIAELFAVEHLIATEPEIIGGKFTGKIQGTPCFQDGKITRFYQWLENQGANREEIGHLYAYSDSFNDLPLLQLAHSPTVVNPDPRLLAHAKSHTWPILNFAAS